MIDQYRGGYVVRCNFCRALAQTKKGVIKIKASAYKAEAASGTSHYHSFTVNNDGVRYDCHLCDSCFDEVWPPSYEGYYGVDY